MARLTNAQKNQLVYYKQKGASYKNEVNTPTYLNSLLETYRAAARPNNMITNKEVQDAKLLEEVLNGIKQIQNNYNKKMSFTTESLVKIVQDQALAELFNQLYMVNPNLFTNEGLVKKGTNSSERGALLENFMNEFITTIDYAFQNIEMPYGPLPQMHRSGQLVDNVNMKNLIINAGDGVIDSATKTAINYFSRFIYKVGQEKKDSGSTTTERQKNNLKATTIYTQIKENGKTGAIQSKQIKTDNTGLNYNISITATATILERVVNALSLATFSDKNYLSNNFIGLGHTNPYRVFLTVADGDTSYKLYRYARMLNCMARHSKMAEHNDVPKMFFRIRAIYELTGAKQRVGNTKYAYQNVMANFINDIGRTKFLVINNPKKEGFLKVLSTAKLAEDIEMNLYFNKKQGSKSILENDERRMSMEQALYSPISMNFEKIFENQ